MTFTSPEILAWTGQYLWPFFRIGAMVGAVPVIGTRLLPVRIRLGFALVLTVVMVPVIPKTPVVAVLSVDALMITATQIFIGLAMGFALRMVFAAFVHGSQIIALQMGLGFASMIDPQNGVQVPMLSQFYIILVTLLFLSFNGHLMVIQVLVDSFHTLPIGETGIDAQNLWSLVSAGSGMLAGAVWIALPAVASLLLVNLAFGVMTRAAPQLNIFAVGFPMTMILGFAAILFSLPSIVPQLESLMGDGFTLTRNLVAGGN